MLPCFINDSEMERTCSPQTSEWTSLRLLINQHVIVARRGTLRPEPHEHENGLNGNLTNRYVRSELAPKLLELTTHFLSYPKERPRTYYLNEDTLTSGAPNLADE